MITVVDATGCKSCNHRAIDDLTGFEVNERFNRLSQRLDMFNRSAWDDTVRSEKVIQFFRSYFTDLAEFKQAEGFRHRDFALRNASWYIADFTADLFEKSHDRKEGFLDFFTLLRPGAKVQLADTTPEQNSHDVKR